ncbi:MAG: hypothetical protein RL033_774 [Pseudomonadota bacterium]
MTRHELGSSAVASDHTPAQSPTLDWDELLKPISSTQPSGPNLEYSTEFAALELLARGTPDRQMGAALVSGQAPDPSAVLRQGSALLQRTKDVRVHVHLLSACLPTLGISAFVSGLSALREVLEHFWDTVHPELDPDDEDRATARANATMGCASPELVRALRQVALLDSHGGGSLCLEDALRALRAAGTEEQTAQEGAWLTSTLREQPPGALEALTASLRLGLDQTIAIAALFAARCRTAPDLQPLRCFFVDALSLLRQHGEPAVATVPRNGGGCAVTSSTPVHSSPGCAADLSQQLHVPRNSITSRDEVLQALEGLCEYYRAQEPASPLPLLLRRCQRLVGLDFLATLRELAPEALATLTWLRGDSHDAARSS